MKVDKGDRDTYAKKAARRGVKLQKPKRKSVDASVYRESNALLLRQRDEAREVIKDVRDTNKLLYRALEMATTQTTRSVDYFLGVARADIERDESAAGQ